MNCSLPLSLDVSTAAGANNTVTAIDNTGGGLTWVLVRRTNTQRGSAEIWRAFAPTAPEMTVTATFGLANASSMTIIAFGGVDTTAPTVPGQWSNREWQRCQRCAYRFASHYAGQFLGLWRR